MKARLVRPVILAGALLAIAGGVAFATRGAGGGSRALGRPVACTATTSPPHGVVTIGAPCGRTAPQVVGALGASGPAKKTTKVGPPGPPGPGPRTGRP